MTNLEVTLKILEWLQNVAKKEKMYFGDTRIYYFDEKLNTHNYLEISQDENYNLIVNKQLDTFPVSNWLEFCNVNGVNMSFENDFYDMMNLSFENKKYTKLEESFSKMLDSCDKYYTLGYAWSLSVYDI